MWTISEMKERGKRTFKANYWPCVVAAFLMSVLAGAFSATAHSRSEDMDFNALMNGMSPEEQRIALMVLLGIFALAAGVALLIRVFLKNPIELGGCAFFRANAEEAPAPLAIIKTGFQNYWHNFAVLFVRDLYLLLWSLLLLVPGLIKAYSYCMVPYILAEHPELSANEVITRSREMMNGNKWRAFLLDLSFVGWILLGVLTLGLGFILWAAPYMESTHAVLYLELKNKANKY